MSIAGLYVKRDPFTDTLAALRAGALVVGLDLGLGVVKGNKLPIDIGHENSPKE
jgi:hypothetical protein